MVVNIVSLNTHCLDSDNPLIRYKSVKFNNILSLLVKDYLKSGATLKTYFIKFLYNSHFVEYIFKFRSLYI